MMRPENYYRAAAVFALCCLFLLVLVVVAVVTPYRVLRVDSLVVVPERACPGEPVGVTAAREWLHGEGLIYGVGSIEIDSEWRDVETGATYPALDADPVPIGPEAVGRVVRQRGLKDRPAPLLAGRFGLVTEYTVRGRVLFLPDYQVIRGVESRNTLAVEEGCPDA